MAKRPKHGISNFPEFISMPGNKNIVFRRHLVEIFDADKDGNPTMLTIIKCEDEIEKPVDTGKFFFIYLEE